MKEVELTKGYKALVDDEDFERINANKYHAVVTVTGPNTIHVSAWWWGPGTYPNRTHHQMSYDVMNLTPADVLPDKLDHADRNALNNQKQNLRIISHRDNALNSDRVINAKGIYYDKKRRRWKAFILQPNKVYVGTFTTEELAKEALLKAKGITQ